MSLSRGHQLGDTQEERPVCTLFNIASLNPITVDKDFVDPRATAFEHGFAALVELAERYLDPPGGPLFF